VPLVLGLLEAREKRVREEIARLREEAERVQAALGEAERALERLVDAHVTVAEVLAEPQRGSVAGSPVPRRTGGMAASVLAPDCQRIVWVLESEAGREGMRCRQLAVALGLQAVPAKVEGLRSKAKPLVERGWTLQVRPGVFTALAVPAGSRHQGGVRPGGRS
jgi:hypothetical protein